MENPLAYSTVNQMALLLVDWRVYHLEVLKESRMILLSVYWMAYHLGSVTEYRMVLKKFRVGPMVDRRVDLMMVV